MRGKVLCEADLLGTGSADSCVFCSAGLVQKPSREVATAEALLLRRVREMEQKHQNGEKPREQKRRGL